MKKIWLLGLLLGVLSLNAALAGYSTITELKVNVIIAQDIKGITKKMVKDKANELITTHLTQVKLSKGAPKYFIDVTVGGFEEKVEENPEVFAFVLVRLIGSGSDKVDSFTKVYQQDWKYFKGNLSKIDDGINGLLKGFVLKLSKKWK
jgi:hypothetical protein